MSSWTLLLLAALATPALSQQAPRELIYGAELMTPQERERYRSDIHGAKGEQERTRMRAQHRERLRERARQKGIALREPHGVRQAAPK